MSPSGAELLRQVKSQIEEVDPAEVAELIDEGVTVVDVRETDEFAAGHLPGAKHVPRSYLESRIEGVVPDRSTQVILYCASGNRSAYAARTLKEELGYEHVRSMTGGITLWKDRGYRGRRPAHAHRRAARALLAPHARSRDRHRGPAEAARREGAAARRRRPRLADGAVPRRCRRRHAGHRRQRRRRPLEPSAPGDPQHRPHRHAQGRLGRAGDPRAEPRRERRQVPDARRRVEHRRDHRGLRRDRRRRRQLPHALPAQRRDRAPEDPRRVRLDPRLRRPAVGLSSHTRARATAACSASRRPPSSRLRAAPTACSGCSPARWGCCRPPRSSS